MRHPNRLEYNLNYSVLGRSLNVLIGIWCEFDVMCSVLQGHARLLGHALV